MKLLNILFKNKIFLIILCLGLILIKIKHFTGYSHLDDLKYKRKYTEHFTINYKDEDEKYINQIAYVSEQKYKEISTFIDNKKYYRINIFIDKNIKELSKRGYVVYIPNYMITKGMTIENNVFIMSPSNILYYNNYEDFQKTLIHEITHSMENKIDPKSYYAPDWLKEGLAIYLSNQKDIIKIKYFIRNYNNYKLKITGGNILGLSLKQDDSYSYTIIEYIINKYGRNKLIKIIRNPDNIENILNTNMDNFTKNWYQYIKTEYNNK